MEESSCIFCGIKFTAGHLVLCTNFIKFRAMRHTVIQIPQFNLALFDRFKEIAVGIKILFCFEEIRDKIFSNSYSWSVTCLCLFCSIRKFFSYLLIDNSKEYFEKRIQSFAPIEQSIPKDNIEAFVINSVGDGLKFVFEKIRSLKCAKEFYILECFQISVKERFLCQCGKAVDGERSMLTVKVQVCEIKDLGVGLLEIYKRSRLNRVFKFCADEKCVLRKSTNLGTLIKAPLYFIIEVEYKLDYYEIMSQDLNLEVKSEDFFIHDKPVDYEIYLLCASNLDRTLIFLNVVGNWFDVESGFYCDLNNMIFNLNSFQCKIDLIVYKQKPSLNSNLQKKTVEVQSLSQHYCIKCKTIKKDDGQCIKCWKQEKISRTCPICDYFNDEGYINCVNCEKIKAKKPNLLQSECPDCLSPVINGQKCKKCFNLQKKPESIRPITASSSVSNVNLPTPPKILCSKCKSPLENKSDICGMCRVPEETKALIPHKAIQNDNLHNLAKSPITPSKNEPSSPVLGNFALKAGKNLMEKILDPPKRPASISKTNCLCLGCGSKLNQNEKRNCAHCMKTHSGQKANCPFCNKFEPICDSCLKKCKKKN